MNYLRIYNELIQSCKLKTDSFAGEIHHILPRSMGGSNDIDNLVKMTYREHFIAHRLLVKIYDNPQMRYAIWRMCNTGKYKVTSKTYEFFRCKHIETVSKWSKDFMKGKTIFKNIDTGEMKLLECESVDYNKWVGVNKHKKLPKSIKSNYTTFKDSNNNMYHLACDDPIIKSLKLKGVGNWGNATKLAADKLKARPWYWKHDSDRQKDIVLLMPNLYDWYINSYDETRPKATGIAKWMSYNNITIKSKILHLAFLKFKEGWKPDNQFYEIYYEIIKNR